MKKVLQVLLVVFLIVTLITGCSSNQLKENQQKNPENTEENLSKSTDIPKDGDTLEEKTSNETIQYPLTVTDQIGREVVIEQPVKKIVSSYYISTAITIALGKKDHLVGIEMKADTRELYKKAAPEIIKLPAVGSGKGLNIEETASLEPDIVIIPQKLKDSVEQLEQLNIPVIVIDPETLENYNACVELLGNVYGCQEKAKELMEYYTDKIEEIEEIVSDKIDSMPTVYLASGGSYLRTCTSNMYQDKLISMAGGINVSDGLEEGYWAEISKEQLLDWNPDYIFPVSYAEYTVDDILGDSDLAQVQAIIDKNVIIFPSSIEPWDYPTPSSVLGILWLTHILHPDVYTKDAYITEAKLFYKTFFQIDVTQEELGL